MKRIKAIILKATLLGSATLFILGCVAVDLTISTEKLKKKGKGEAK